MSALAYISGLLALLLMSMALYYINRENDQLRAENCVLLAMGEGAAEGNPRVHVVQLQVNGPEDAEKILKQVESDLQKIFHEAAQGKA